MMSNTDKPAENMRLLIVIGARNEETQLEETVRGLQAACSPKQVAGMVLLLASKTTEGCLRTANAMQNAGFHIPVEAVQQMSGNVPDSIKAILGGRREITHVLFLASDGCLNASAVASLVARAQQDRCAVYKISRTLPGGGFSSRYSAAEILLYKLFCVFVRMLFCCEITDPAFFVTIAPVHLFQFVQFSQSSILFGVEWIYALLRRRVPIFEIPAKNLPRTEMEDSSTVLSRLRYAAIAVRIRFMPLSRLWEDKARSIN